MAPLPPEAIAAGVGIATVAAGALYSYLSGESTSVSVDVDDDGTDEATVDFGDDEQEAEKPNNLNGNVANNPTPDEVLDKEGLTDVKGIQETRAENLREAGYDTPADLYYTTDENLEKVKQIGPYTVEQIRDDIGGIDYNPNGESDGETKSGSGETAEQSTQTESSNSKESSNDEAQ